MTILFCVKQYSDESMKGCVHALVTRWASEQLHGSRALCRAVVKATAATVTQYQLRVSASCT